MKTLSHNQRRGGFALILSLGLMALMVLLAVTLSALISTESESSRQTRDNALAKQNAYMGMLLAVGQLQQYAGPDQRITAAATILDESTNTVSAQANPHWTGVWATADANFATQTLSHYSGTSKNVATIRDAAKTWLVSRTSSTSTVSPATALTATASVTLAGANSVKDTADYVKVPLVTLNQGDGKSLSKYAWWVGDEGVKGNLAFERDVSATLSVGQYQNLALKNGSALLKAGSNSSGATLFGDITAYTYNDLLTRDNQLNYVGTATAASKELFHDASLYSQGVMANVKDGGLRKDLSDYTKLPTGPIFTSTTSNKPMYWEMVKSFLAMGNDLNLTSTNSTASVSPRQQYPTNQSSIWQHGIHPIPVRLGTYVDLAFIQQSNNRYSIRLYFLPVIALWNPYDVTIRPARYRFAQWSGDQASKFQFAVGRWNGNTWERKGMLTTQVVGGSNVEDTLYSAYPFSSGTLMSNSSDPASGTYGSFTMYFTVEDTTGIAPGQTVVFTPRAMSAYSRTNPMNNILYSGFRPGYGFYIDLTPSDNRYLSPYQFEVKPTEIYSIRDYYIDWGIQFSSAGNELNYNEWWYFSELQGTSGRNNYMTLSGLNRGGLGYSFPRYATTSNQVWTTAEDGRPRAFRPSVRTAGDIRALPNGTYVSDNAASDITDFPAYGFLYELKQTLNDQNFDSHEGRRRWAASFNPRGIKGHYLDSLGTPTKTSIGQTNQSYIGQLRGRSYNLSENQSDLYYTPNVSGNKLFFGYSAHEGATSTVMFHIPRKDVPVGGVADLSQINISGPDTYHATGTRSPTNLIPTYAVGNSFASPFLPDGTLMKDYTGGNNPASIFDYSYLLNEALWDKYFSSTDLLDGKGPHDPRFVPATATSSQTFTYSSSQPAYDYAAVKWLQAGAFNINSTSEKAWQMLLASNFGGSVSKSDSSTLTVSDAAPFLRVGSSYGDIFDGASESDTDAYNGFRALTEDEITALSKQIVKQVKARGPFYSVAEFVNRTLEGGPDDYRLKGPLQTAIDDSGINDGFTEEIASGDATTNDPTGNYPNPDALYGAAGTGVPGFLTQADLLQKIGNRLSARSDTFRVRGYGEVSENGVTSRAYCEAVVQRMPEYLNKKVNNTGDEAITFPPTDSANKALGRRFVIRSVRWLTPDEI